MDWQSDTAKLTDAEFPGTSALIRLLQARLLLLVDPAPLKAYLHVEQDIAGNPEQCTRHCGRLLRTLASRTAPPDWHALAQCR